ncbi:MAG: DEAD/DEAH box helicase [Parabacteroides sp.]|nr:DEAD/DEAH box helicase [Parabacteroides sp.]
MLAEDLFPFLKNKNTSINLQTTAQQEIYFRIEKDEHGFFIYIVDKDGQPVVADYHNFSGDTFNLLRMIDSIQEKKESQFSWDTNRQRIYLGEYGHLLYIAIRCDNLRDSLNRPLRQGHGATKLLLHIEASTLANRLAPHFILHTEDGDYDNFQLLSDSFALAGRTIYPIDPVGENFVQLAFFNTPFNEAQLDLYLSVLYSYMTHIDVSYEDYEILFSDEQIKTKPTLIFEKADEDQALYLYLTQSIPQQNDPWLKQIDLTWIVQTNSEGRTIKLARVLQTPITPHKEQLLKTLERYASSRQQKKDIYEENNHFIVPPEIASAFLLYSLPELLDNYILLGAERLKKYNIQLVHPQLNLTLSSGIDFLEGEASVAIEQESFSLQDLLAQYKKQRYITLSNGNRALLDASYIRKLERVFTRGKRKGSTRLSFFDLPEVEELLEQSLEGDAFKQHRQIYEGFNNLAKEPFQPSKVKATLRPYQQEGVKWLKYLYDNKLGGCLADDMGLGKTLQTITLLSYLYPKSKQPSLIVMPRSLLFNWQNELQKFAPTLKVYTYYENSRNLEKARKHSLILTTYAMVRNDIECFKEEKFHCVILDESQNIKNVNAQTTQAIYLLQAQRRFALSGTPIENNLTELYSLFRFLNPTMFGSFDNFNQTYTLPIQRDGDKETMSALRKKISPFLLRRLKKDVLSELPDRMEQTISIDMSDEQASLYEKRRSYYYRQIKQTIATEGLQRSKFVMFQALNELRRIASIPENLSDGVVTSPKLSLLIDNLLDAISNGHKAVVFFNFIAGLELAGEMLDNHGIDFVSMTGSTHDRKSLVERFQNDPRCKVFLMTLKTGGVGLNLTAADTVFIFEPWWNKAAEEQGISRLHRIGQTNKVLSYSLITRGSIEEKIQELQAKKTELFNELIGNDASTSKDLSEEDIDFILGK